jgi:hypothetical protein
VLGAFQPHVMEEMSADPNEPKRGKPVAHGQAIRKYSPADIA